MKKDLLRLFEGDEVLANTASAVIESNDIDFVMSFPAAKVRRAECYSPPSINDLKLHILDNMLNGYGVEGFPIADGYTEKSFCSYVNMGDTYATTVLCVGDDFEIGCWGDIAEAYDYDNNLEF
jgi:hypothetical protein